MGFLCLFFGNSILSMFHNILQQISGLQLLGAYLEFVLCALRFIHWLEKHIWENLVYLCLFFFAALNIFFPASAFRHFFSPFCGRVCCDPGKNKVCISLLDAFMTVTSGSTGKDWSCFFACSCLFFFPTAFFPDLHSVHQSFLCCSFWYSI